MKNFKYRILVNDDTMVKSARKWCYKEFGEIPTTEKRIRSRKTKRKYTIGPVYDIENAVWYNKVTGKSNPKAFYFKKEEDAVAFKLVWL